MDQYIDFETKLEISEHDLLSIVGGPFMYTITLQFQLQQLQISHEQGIVKDKTEIDGFSEEKKKRDLIQISSI